MLYDFLRPFLFSLDAESAHEFALKAANLKAQLGFATPATSPTLPVRVMGIDFPNPVGLAAGLDKNGAYIEGLAGLGFGFLEIGTVTPRPQAGNPKPRLFRLPQAQAVINRMGFNNAGVDVLVENAENALYNGVLGINIGKNADTPMAQAVEDYRCCLKKVYPEADYVTVNISSPNTKNLRQLQEGDELAKLLGALKETQHRLCDKHGYYVPLVVKIAPDLEPEQIETIARLLITHQMDGVIATNTTLAREAVAHLPLGQETGGLSGQPVRARSTEVIRTLAHHLDGAIPIIGAGGILSGEDALEKMEAGASLIQLYSGLVYRGPALIEECIRTLKRAQYARR